MSKKFPDDKNISKPLLREINDRSHGGFVLFSFSEDGLPEVNSNFEDHITAMALQHYINNWSKAIEAITMEATVDTLAKEILGDEQNDEQDGEEPEEI